MVKSLTTLLNGLTPIEILVVGDLMLDRYTFGNIERISPEAPVPVLHAKRIESHPGGAGNVMLNLRAIGSKVTAFGRVGNDLAGKDLIEDLIAEGIDTTAILTEKQYVTPVKNRMIAAGQQMMRIDQEEISDLSPAQEAELIERADSLIKRCDLVAISDYGKGLLTRSFLKALIDLAHKYQKPILIDPKGSDFSKYRGATLIKPNLGEAYRAANVPLSTSIEELAKTLFDQCHCEQLIITQGDRGSILYNASDAFQHFSVRSRQVRDVTGAGDTFLAMLCFAMANQLDLPAAIELANSAASLAVEKIGCAQITLAEIVSEFMSFYSGRPEEVSLLHHLFEEQEYSIIAINNAQATDPHLFYQLNQLAKNSHPFIIYLIDQNSDDLLCDMLLSFEPIDYIIEDRNQLIALTEKNAPSKIYRFEKQHLIPLQLNELVLQSIP